MVHNEATGVSSQSEICDENPIKTNSEDVSLDQQLETLDGNPNIIIARKADLASPSNPPYEKPKETKALRRSKQNKKTPKNVFHLREVLDL